MSKSSKPRQALFPARLKRLSSSTQASTLCTSAAPSSSTCQRSQRTWHGSVETSTKFRNARSRVRRRCRRGLARWHITIMKMMTHADDEAYLGLNSKIFHNPICAHPPTYACTNTSVSVSLFHIHTHTHTHTFTHTHTHTHTHTFSNSFPHSRSFARSRSFEKIADVLTN